MNENWLHNNQKYWENIAEDYYSSYKDSWSDLENIYVQKKLVFLEGYQKAKILDLGCGNGLGYKLCTSINSNIEYVGVDVSVKMLRRLKLNYPEAQICNTSMSNLSIFKSSTFDIVISTFTSFSYTDDYAKTIAEITRVLKPEGQIFISVLSKYSLRRLLHFKFGIKEYYRTRGISSKNFSYAWVFSIDKFRQLFASAYCNIHIYGYNIFWGNEFLSKFPALWRLNSFISLFLPNLSHELILKATKKT